MAWQQRKWWLRQRSYLRSATATATDMTSHTIEELIVTVLPFYAL